MFVTHQHFFAKVTDLIEKKRENCLSKGSNALTGCLGNRKVGLTGAAVFDLGCIALGIIIALGKLNLVRITSFVVGGGLILLGLVSTVADLSKVSKDSKPPATDTI